MAAIKFSFPEHLQFLWVIKGRRFLILKFAITMILLIESMEGDCFEFLLEGLDLLCLMYGQSLRLLLGDQGVCS